MQEREMAKELGLEAEFEVETKEELEERWAQGWWWRGRKMLEEGKILIKGKERPWRLGPQGILRGYSQFIGRGLVDTATDSISMFHHLIPHHSGRHRHQGGFSLFVLEGKGYTVVDGGRNDWEEGDLILLAIKPEGCEHQHFNARPDGKPSRWMAFPARFALEASGSGGGGQRDNSPLWKKYRPDYQGPVVDAKEELKWQQEKERKEEASSRPPSHERIEMNRFEELVQIRDTQREWLKKARVVVKFKELPWEINRMGKIKWYLHPKITDTAHRAVIFYVQEIPPGSRSAKMQWQGGWLEYIWKGKGYSIINSKRYDWEEEDALFYPVNMDSSLTFQHFNIDPGKPAWLVAAIPNITDSVGMDLGAGLEVLEECPEWKAQQAQGRRR